MNRRLLSIGLIFALSACGAGGGSKSLPSLGGGTGSSTQNVTVKFSVPTPTGSKAIARGRQYVSYSTDLAVVTYTSNGSTFVEPVAGTTSSNTYVTDVSEATGSADSPTSGKACVNTVAGGPARTCTITLAVPTGLYSIELSLWSGTYTDAHTPQGDELSVSAHTPLAIAAGSSNAINFAVAGINAVVSSVYLLLDHSTVNWNTGSAVNLSIDLKDAEGNHIMSDGTGNGLVTPSGSAYTAHITLDTTAINGCTASGPLAYINGASPPYDVSAPPSGTVPITQNDACLYSLTVTSSDPPTGNSSSVTNAPLQTSGVNQTYPSLSGISDAKATALDDQGRVWVFGAPQVPGAGGIERLNADGTVTQYAAATGDVPMGGIEGSDGNMYIVNGDGNLTYLPVNASSATAPVGVSLTMPNPATETAPQFTGIARDSATGDLWVIESAYGALIDLAAGGPYVQSHAYELSLPGIAGIDVEENTVLIGDGAFLRGYPTSNPFGSGNFSSGTSAGTITGISKYDSSDLLITGTGGYAIVKLGTGQIASGGSSQVAGVRAKDGAIYLAGSTNVQQVSFDGSSFTNGGTYNNNFPSGSPAFGNPTVDLNGNLWFAVNGTSGVMEFAPPANWNGQAGFTINARQRH